MGVIKRYMAFVTPYKKQIALTMVIGMIKFSIPLTLPLLLKYVIDDVIQGSGSAEEKTSSLLIIMGIMLVLFLVMSARLLNTIDNTMRSGQAVRYYLIFGKSCFRIFKSSVFVIMPTRELGKLFQGSSTMWSRQRSLSSQVL